MTATDADEVHDINEPSDAGEPVDGRVARRLRNIDAVLDVVMEMFVEEAMFPTIEQAATRSGLSLRSLYRYFSDQGELVEAAIKHTQHQSRELARVHAIGEGPLDARIDDFVDMRIRIYESFGPVFRATAANALRYERVRQERARNLDLMREQFERQFAPELSSMAPADRDATQVAGDVLTQLDALDYLHRHRELSVNEIRAVLTKTLRSLLS